MTDVDDDLDVAIAAAAAYEAKNISIGGKRPSTFKTAISSSYSTPPL